MEEKMPHDKIIQNEILLQALSLKLAGIRHKKGFDLEVAKLVQLRRDVYSGKIETLAKEYGFENYSFLSDPYGHECAIKLVK